jgi:hypothetical protein
VHCPAEMPVGRSTLGRRSVSYEGLNKSIDAVIDHLKKKNRTPPSKRTNFGAKCGAAMIAVMPKRHGEVFNAGTASWINGLREVGFYMQQITRPHAPETASKFDASRISPRR